MPFISTLDVAQARPAPASATARATLERLSVFAPVLVRLPAGNALTALRTADSARLATLKRSIVVLPAAADLADQVVQVLEAGADRVALQAHSPVDLAALAATFPKNRIMAHLSTPAVTPLALADLKRAVDALNGAVSGYVVHVGSNPAAGIDQAALADLVKLVQAGEAERTLVLDFLAGPGTFAEAAALAALPGVTVAVPAPRITYPGADDMDQSSAFDFPAAALVTTGMTSDRADGLFPTVVADEHGTALGLVYSSRASIAEALRTGTGVYHSRKRGVWHKGATSGATQALVRIDVDCDADALQFVVRQAGVGFCHRATPSCFGTAAAGGVPALAATLEARKTAAPAGSYTHRLFNDTKLLHAKLLEEAHELIEAVTPAEVAAEAADVLYFALAKATAHGVSLADIEAVLDARARKVTRRPGNAKPQYAAAIEAAAAKKQAAAAAPAAPKKPEGGLKMKHVDLASVPADSAQYTALLQRPILDSDKIMGIVRPIVDAVRTRGDAAVLEYTAKFDGVALASPVLLPPFAQHYDAKALTPAVRAAIDTAVANVDKFHRAQLETEPLVVETMPGITCSRVVRPIERVGLYVPGGSAVLPSSTLMLGVPAAVAGCEKIVIATPPRKDGSVAPEVLYVADKVGAAQVVMAGGAQAVAAMAYGTETVLKVDKICGPGNQFVTAAKMLCTTDTAAMVAIDMPAGPSEVLVIADGTSDPRFVAADLLSQAEHGPDSQVVLVAVDMTDADVARVEAAVEKQANLLPRVDIVRQCLPKSWIVRAPTMAAAVAFSNAYAPEHLILNFASDDLAKSLVDQITNAGSVFVGAYSPESCGDYASGTNHTLPTYGYARMYSGVNTHTFVKHITTQHLSRDGLDRLADCVITLAEVEGLDAHARAVAIRVGRFDA
ncbi:trifunctional histidinol dehydrogenase [Blastocladiella emersonii ATCC 22665]|nr:trifunctional histidinol dehydrogenase [Blastocladiella emersonii ATCC 22665]